MWTQRHTQMEAGSRSQRDVATSQQGLGPPEAGRNKDPPQRLWKNYSPTNTLTLASNFWPPALCENKFLRLEASRLWSFVTAAIGN